MECWLVSSWAHPKTKGHSRLSYSRRQQLPRPSIYGDATMWISDPPRISHKILIFFVLRHTKLYKLSLTHAWRLAKLFLKWRSPQSSSSYPIFSRSHQPNVRWRYLIKKNLLQFHGLRHQRPKSWSFSPLQNGNNTWRRLFVPPNTPGLRTQAKVWEFSFRLLAHCTCGFIFYIWLSIEL